jgi:hypothetical protein
MPLLHRPWSRIKALKQTEQIDPETLDGEQLASRRKAPIG